MCASFSPVAVMKYAHRSQMREKWLPLRNFQVIAHHDGEVEAGTHIHSQEERAAQILSLFATQLTFSAFIPFRAQPMQWCHPQ